MKKHTGLSPRRMRFCIFRPATLGLLLVMLCACGHHGQGASPGILASERMACQRLIPPEQAACLEQARIGTVIYVPERLEHRGERLEQRRGNR